MIVSVARWVDASSLASPRGVHAVGDAANKARRIPAKKTHKPSKMQAVKNADWAVFFVFIEDSYGRGASVGRTRGVGLALIGGTVSLGVTVGLGGTITVAVGVAVNVAVGVGVGVNAAVVVGVGEGGLPSRKPRI
jgi:hypothetical protein